MPNSSYTSADKKEKNQPPPLSPKIKNENFDHKNQMTFDNTKFLEGRIDNNEIINFCH